MDKQIRVNLPETMISRLDEMSAEENISRSAYIAKAIEHYWQRGNGGVNTNNHRDSGPIVWSFPINRGSDSGKEPAGKSMEGRG